MKTKKTFDTLEKFKSVKWHLHLDAELRPGCEKQAIEIFRPVILNLMLTFFFLLTLNDIFAHHAQPLLAGCMVLNKALAGIIVKIGQRCLPKY
jgi:hypothetical protein